jgi:hypothetical protein
MTTEHSQDALLDPEHHDAGDTPANHEPKGETDISDFRELYVANKTGYNRGNGTGHQRRHERHRDDALAQKVNKILDDLLWLAGCLNGSLQEDLTVTEVARLFALSSDNLVRLSSWLGRAGVLRTRTVARIADCCETGLIEVLHYHGEY